jgi:hypothetical protein
MWPALQMDDEKQCIIRSFHSSVLWKKHSSNVERFIIPLARCWTQKALGQVWAATFCSALSGKRRLTRCELKRPSFGCLIYCKQATRRVYFVKQVYWLHPYSSRLLFVHFHLCIFTSLLPKTVVYSHVMHVTFIHGHRTLKAPHPVRSAQLTRVPPS